MRKFLNKKILLLLSLSFLLQGCSNENFKNKDLLFELNNNFSETIKEEEKEKSKYNVIQEKNLQDEVYSVTIRAVGDDLIHSPIFKYGEKNGSDYSFMFENVKEEIQSADLAVINQETMFINDKSKLSSYPCFGSPIEIGNAIINAGFDIVTLATNHSLDKGMEGINDTINFFENNHDKITYLGLNKTQEDYNTIKIIEKNNITFALLNYTYGTNGIPIPKNYPYCVNTFYDKEKIIKDIAKAEEIADVTIVFPHWGTEYIYEADGFQQEWTNLFLENGVDIVIGTHPHVVEPYELLTNSNGNEMLIYYSLGNFISSQDEKPRVLGGMAEITILKQNDKISFKEYTMYPLVTHQSNGFYTTYLLEDYSDNLANKHKLGVTKEYLYDLFENIIKMEEN